MDKTALIARLQESAANDWPFCIALGICIVIALFGFLALLEVIDNYRFQRKRLAHRAEVLVATETRKLRAAQHRAAERDWGRAA